MRAQKCHQYDENVIDIVLLRSFPYISFSSPLSINQAHMCHQQDFFILNNSFFYFHSNSYISNILNIYNPEKDLIVASQTIRDNIFQIRSQIILYIFFGYVRGVYKHILLCGKFHLNRRR